MRTYIIFNISELNLIDFSQVMETEESTLRKSADGTLSFITWIDDNVPSFIDNLTTKQGPYTKEQILEILNTADWSIPDPEDEALRASGTIV